MRRENVGEVAHVHRRDPFGVEAFQAEELDSLSEAYREVIKTGLEELEHPDES